MRVYLVNVTRSSLNRTLRSHTVQLAYDPASTNDALCKRGLPHNVSDVLTVLFPKDANAAKQDALRATYTARRDVLHELVTFYIANNEYYKDVVYSPSSTVTAPFVETDAGGVAEDNGLAGFVDPAVVQNTNAVNVHTSVSDAASVPLATAIGAPVTNNSSVLEFRSGSSLMKEDNPLLIAYLWADLFPFGRGLPTEARPVACSELFCLRRALRVGSRTFAPSSGYVAWLFDRVSRRRGLRAQMFPVVRAGVQQQQNARTAALERAGQVPKEKVLRALQYVDECLLAKRTQQPLPPQPDDLEDALAMVGSIRRSSAVMFNTPAERRRHIHEINALVGVYGFPSMFATFNYRDHQCVSLLHLATDEEAKTAVERMRAVGANLVASFLHFDRLVRQCLANLVGVHRGRCVRNGLFGPVAAYFGEAESQERESLHIHVLIWGAWHSDFGKALQVTEHVVRESSQRAEYVAYVDSMISCSSSLHESVLQCMHCGESGHLRPLATKRAVAPGKHAHGEPATLKCGKCSATLGTVALLHHTCAANVRRVQCGSVQVRQRLCARS